MLAVLRRDNEANTKEWYLWFRIHCPVDDSNWFSISITRLVMTRRILKFNGNSPLQHQEKACSIVQMPRSRSPWGNLRSINAYSYARIFGQRLVKFFKAHDAV